MYNVLFQYLFGICFFFKMQNCCNINLVFNEQKHTISVTFQRYLQLLNYFPEKIGITQYNHQYYNIESIVSEETFDNFKKYLTDSLEPEIKSNNLHEYYFLSQEFQVLTDYLSGKMNEDIINLSILILSMNSDKSQSEKYVSMHLDDFIDKYIQELKEIPINSLFNIFYHPERVLNDHQKAYDFITKKCANSFLYILLESLDLKKLNSKSKFESFLKSQERLGFQPIFNQSFFDSIEEKVNQYESIINENKELKETIQRMKYSQFEYQGNGNERFNGIIRYLTKKCGGNVHEKGLVKVTGKYYIKE